MKRKLFSHALLLATAIFPLSVHADDSNSTPVTKKKLTVEERRAFIEKWRAEHTGITKPLSTNKVVIKANITNNLSIAERRARVASQLNDFRNKPISTNLPPALNTNKP
jgi:DNA gyrase/topoisomerase IV subunit B